MNTITSNRENHIKTMDEEEKLLELYKISEENHRFYVEKRFMIISFYFPAVTILSSGIYALTTSFNKVLVCVFAFALTVFLYSLENRNWILSNICLESSYLIGQKLDGDSNLHLRLSKSYYSKLPKGATLLDKVIRKVGKSQHKAVSRLTTFLLLYWISLALLSLV